MDKLKDIAAKIIADYKEHYDFPWQGESHMEDCIMTNLQSLSQEAVRDEALEEFPVELMSHSMDDDKRLMARKLLKMKRIERAYCAANDYINALTGEAILSEASLEKIKKTYWEAVKEVQ